MVCLSDITWLKFTLVIYLNPNMAKPTRVGAADRAKALGFTLFKDFV